MCGGGLLDIYLYSIIGCPEKEVKIKRLELVIRGIRKYSDQFRDQ